WYRPEGLVVAVEGGGDELDRAVRHVTALEELDGRRAATPLWRGPVQPAGSRLCPAAARESDPPLFLVVRLVAVSPADLLPHLNVEDGHSCPSGGRQDAVEGKQTGRARVPVLRS